MHTFARPLVALALVGASHAAPFQVHSASELRPDYVVDWSSFSSTHGAAVPDWQSFPVPGQGNVAVLGYSAADMTIHNNTTNGGLFTPGVLLSNPGPQGISIYPPSLVQGVGFTIEHLQGVQATYRVEIWGDGQAIANFEVDSPGDQGNPIFIGFVDPEARISIISIGATPGERFAITNPIFQLGPDPLDSLADLPVAAEATINVRPAHTYLHEGIDKRTATEATLDASEDFPNTCELAQDFPGIRAGDILHFERQGISRSGGTLNQTMALFSSSEEIAEGTEYRRVPGALEAGQGFYTPAVTSEGRSFATGTNIPQDFVVGKSSFVVVPEGAQFAFFSLAKPSVESSPVDVKMGHIPRTPFLDWLDGYGISGTLADLDHDLDGDGLSLIEEFAFQKDPTVNDSDRASDSGFAFTPRLGANNGPDQPLSIVFGARAQAPLRYHVDFSSDLETWLQVPSTEIEPIAADGDGLSIFQAIDPLGNQPRRFSKLRVEYIPPLSS